MTNQEGFNKAWKHFVIDKGERSILDGHGCRYRLDLTPECSVRCGVGVLIPDDEYKPKFDKSATVVGKIYMEVPALAGMGVGFLINLQEAHDSSIMSDERPFGEIMRERLTAVANLRNLEVPNDHIV